MRITIKRAYQAAEEEDGFRVLVDRLWPRGVSKEKAKLDCWLKDIAPSDELRRWFNHEEDKWDDFRNRYIKELDANPDAVAEFRQAVKGQKHVTLVYGAKDEQHNQAVVLQQYLGGRQR
ncbi:MAG: DUF488 domain-containing protein [Planctomycetes bacterium]|nr:DUF488 domain-containing protein [Planctomycetota bacterium]